MKTKLACSLVPLLVLVGVVGCGRTPDAQIDLTGCVQGVWLEGDDACLCSQPLFTTPECSAPDCRESNTLVLKSDGTSKTLILRWSDARGTTSAAGGSGAVLRGQWNLVNGNAPRLVQTFDATHTSYETRVACTQTQLVRMEKNTYDRANDVLARAVESADNGSWQGTPMK